MFLTTFSSNLAESVECYNASVSFWIQFSRVSRVLQYFWQLSPSEWLNHKSCSKAVPAESVFFAMLLTTFEYNLVESV